MASKKTAILSHRLLLYIFLCSGVVTLLASFFQLSILYHSGLAQAQKQVEQLEKVHVPSLAKSLWVFDREQLRAQLEGMNNYPDIHFLSLQPNEGERIVIGQEKTLPYREKSLPLFYNLDGKQVALGQLRVQWTNAHIKATVMDQFWIILISQGIKTFLVSAFILFLINFMVAKPVEQIADYLRQVDFEKKQELVLVRPWLGPPDEIDELASSIRKLQQRLLASFAALHSEVEQHHRTQKSLRQQAALIENVMDTIPAFIYWRDRQGRFLGANELYAKKRQSKLRDLIGKKLEDLPSLPELSVFHQLDLDVLQTQKAKWSQEIRIEQEGGGEAQYVQSVVPMYDDREQVFAVLGVFMDISSHRKMEREREKMQEQVMRAAKMASIGELAAGVGHEVNNPLAIVQGNLELLEYHLESQGLKDTEVEKLVQNQMLAIHRIRGIVDGLRSFARKDEQEEKQVVDAHEALKETHGMLVSLYKQQSIDLQLDLQAVEHRFLVNRSLVQQALLNLISNAKDALLERTQGEEKWIRIRSFNQKEFLVIEIADNGIGMSEEIQEKIFAPYFTTKASGKGTGIGLDLTQKILREHKAEIRVKSKPGEGTSFLIEFPLPAKFARKTAAQLEAKFSGRLLLVDDDPSVRLLMAKHLEKLGFEIEECGSLEEAVESIRRNLPDLLFTDMKMPGGSGLELLQQLQKEKLLPTWKVLVTGGLDEQAEVNEMLEPGLAFDLVLNKPFSRKELERSLRLLFESAA